MFAYMYEYFSATWLIEHNQERCKVRNVNSSWESGTRLRSLPVGKIRKQMVGDRKMPEDCRSPEKARHPVREVREGLLKRRGWYLCCAGGWG